VIHTRSEEQPPAKIGANAHVNNSLLSNGAIVDGSVERSVLSPGVYIAEGSTVVNSIIMNDCKIGAGSIIQNAILDKEIVVGNNVTIGSTQDIHIPNQKSPHILNTGLTIVGKGVNIPDGMQIGKNVIIEPHAGPAQFTSTQINNGETVQSPAGIF